MEKKELLNILSEIFLPLGFKKKSHCWSLHCSEISKIINLQKSKYSNRFYINYGFCINNLPLEDMMHIYNRLGSFDSKENANINELLDLENNMNDEERTKNLKLILYKMLVLKFSSINNEAELLSYLKTRSNFNDIPLIVKKYFNL